MMIVSIAVYAGYAIITPNIAVPLGGERSARLTVYDIIKYLRFRISWFYKICNVDPTLSYSVHGVDAVKNRNVWVRF